MKDQRLPRRRLGLVAGLLCLALASSALPASAEMSMVGQETEQLSLLPGYSRIYTLDEPASNIVVGNPQIISVSLIDPLHVLLTPTSRGTGNLLFLDGDKKVIKSLRLEVGIAPASAGVTSRDVHVYRSMVRSNYVCSARDCVPAGQALSPAN